MMQLSELHCDHAVKFARWQHPAMGWGEVCCVWYYLLFDDLVVFHALVNI